MIDYDKPLHWFTLLNLKFSKSYIFLRFGLIKDSIIENQQKGAEKSGV